MNSPKIIDLYLVNKNEKIFMMLFEKIFMMLFDQIK